MSKLRLTHFSAKVRLAEFFTADFRLRKFSADFRLKIRLILFWCFTRSCFTPRLYLFSNYESEIKTSNSHVNSAIQFVAATVPHRLQMPNKYVLHASQWLQWRETSSAPDSDGGRTSAAQHVGGAGRFAPN